MPKKVLCALPPGLLEQIDFVAAVEHRNRSGLIRESLRRYIEQFKRNGNRVPNLTVSMIEDKCEKHEELKPEDEEPALGKVDAPYVGALVP